MIYPHVFAGNPLNRGEVERRDEDWINEKAKESTTKFLAMRNLNPLIFTEPEPAGIHRIRTATRVD